MALDPTEFAAAMDTYLAATTLSMAHRRGLASAVPATLRQGEPYFATDTGALYIGDGSGGTHHYDVAHVHPVCMVTKSALQTIGTSSYTAIYFDTETKDASGMHDNSTNPTRITVPSAGQYLATACIEFAVNATGFRVALLRKNGTTVAMSQVLSSGSLSDRLVVPAIIDCAANDYIELFVWQNSGGNLNVDATSAYSPTLSVVKIS